MMPQMLSKWYLLVVNVMVSFNLHHLIPREYEELPTCTNYLFIVLDHQNAFTSIKNHLLFLMQEKIKGTRWWLKDEPLLSNLTDLTRDRLLFQPCGSRKSSNSSFLNPDLLECCQVFKA